MITPKLERTKTQLQDDWNEEKIDESYFDEDLEGSEVDSGEEEFEGLNDQDLDFGGEDGGGEESISEAEIMKILQEELDGAEKKEKKTKKQKQGKPGKGEQELTYEEDIAKHKEEIEYLKQNDPEFVKFLEENDKKLLDFVCEIICRSIFLTLWIIRVLIKKKTLKWKKEI